MPMTLTERPAQTAASREPLAPRRRTRVLALAEARWAAAATVLFLIALPLQLTGVTVWAWGPLWP